MATNNTGLTYGSNLLTNPGFESALGVEWVATSATLTRASDPRTGTYALDAASDGTTQWGAAQGLTSLTNGFYHYEIYGKKNTASYYGFKVLDDGNSANVVNDTYIHNDATYTKQYATRWLTLTTAGIYLYAYDGTPTGLSTRYDDIAIKKIDTVSTFFDVVTAPGTGTYSVPLTLPAGCYNMAGMVLKCDSASTPANYVVASIYINYGAYKALLIKCVAGVLTVLIAETDITYGAGKVLRVDVTTAGSDKTYALYYDGAQVSTTKTITDADINSGVLFGKFATDSVPTFGNLTVPASSLTVNGVSASAVDGVSSYSAIDGVSV